MSKFGKPFIAGVMLVAPSIALVAVAEAQKPIRIGASLSQTGAYAAGGQAQLRGYQLCVKHMNDKGGARQPALSNPAVEPTSVSTFGKTFTASRRAARRNTARGLVGCYHSMIW